ncbi:MAG: HD domain-containing protein [Candidatus Shapirobacteria bacterium]|jgi:5'-deoxynucleotidase YfbR-like HD superfamily hydrolase
MTIRANDIFTPQGILEEVEKDPKLDFLMNIFNIPRAFGVSGFGGNWDVGKHSYATALIAVFWAKFNKYPEVTRNKLVIMALLHDLHESVTGDILPMFKTDELRSKLDELQNNILEALEVEYDENLEKDLKICDLVAFLYEVKQVSPNIMHPKKLNLANVMANRQLETIYKYCEKKGIEKKKIQKFLNWLEI